MTEIKALESKKIEADKKEDAETSLRFKANIKKKEDYIRSIIGHDATIQ